MPKIKGPFWVVLLFGRAKLNSIKWKMGLSARKWGPQTVQTRKTSPIKNPAMEFISPGMCLCERIL